MEPRGDSGLPIWRGDKEGMERGELLGLEEVLEGLLSLWGIERGLVTGAKTAIEDENWLGEIEEEATLSMSISALWEKEWAELYSRVGIEEEMVEKPLKQFNVLSLVDSRSGKDRPAWMVQQQ